MKVVSDSDNPQELGTNHNPWSILSLTYPFWGTVLTVALMCKISEIFFYIGVMLGFISGLPILVSTSPVFVKAVLLGLYYFTGVFVVFLLGWSSMCWFCPSCH